MHIATARPMNHPSEIQKDPTMTDVTMIAVTHEKNPIRSVLKLALPKIRTIPVSHPPRPLPYPEPDVPNRMVMNRAIIVIMTVIDTGQLVAVF